MKINEKAIQKIGDLESFFQSVKKPAQLKVEILRKGKTVAALLDLAA